MNDVNAEPNIFIVVPVYGAGDVFQAFLASVASLGTSRNAAHDRYESTH